jgi:choline dehydrogenase-like flavoprotein
MAANEKVDAVIVDAGASGSVYAAVLGAAGAKDVWSARGAMPTIHLMGGTIMGTDTSNSVVDSYGQTHEIPNLYIAGPGIFATAGASNPTYTIFALSLRGAEQLAAQWSRVAG